MKQRLITSSQSSNWIKKEFFLKHCLLSIVFPIAIGSIVSTHSFSQDTLTKKHVHSPRLAMIFSACLPGLGQAYNKKYWKIPIVYASIGTTVYFFNFNNKLYHKYKQSYISKTDTLSGIVDHYPEYNADQVKELQDYHRKYRDLNFILTALVYTLNIVDAYADAHLMNFDVSDDLSLKVFPVMNISSANSKPAAGLSLALTF